MSFRDPAQEKAYRVHFANQQSVSDTYWVVTTSLIGGAGFAKINFPAGSLEWLIVVAHVSVLLASNALLAYFIFYRRDLYAKWRTSVLMFARLHRIFALRTSMSSTRFLAKRNFTRLLFYRVFGAVPQASLYVVVSVVSTLIKGMVPFLRFQLIGLYQVLTCGPFTFIIVLDAVQYMCPDPEIMTATLVDANNLLGRWLGAFYHRSAPFPTLIANPIATFSCVSAQMWSVTMFGSFAVPLAMTSLLEERSRQKWLKSVGGVPPLRPSMMVTVVHTVALLIIFGGVWYIFIDSLGVMAFYNVWGLRWILG